MPRVEYSTAIQTPIWDAGGVALPCAREVLSYPLGPWAGSMGWGGVAPDRNCVLTTTVKPTAPGAGGIWVTER